MMSVRAGIKAYIEPFQRDWISMFQTREYGFLQDSRALS